MTFLGIALDGTQEEYDEFIADSGVTSLTHISQDTHAELVDGFFDEYDINSVPTFILQNEDGETRDHSGWSESSVREDLDWLTA